MHLKFILIFCLFKYIVEILHDKVLPEQVKNIYCTFWFWKKVDFVFAEEVEVTSVTDMAKVWLTLKNLIVLKREFSFVEIICMK